MQRNKKVGWWLNPQQFLRSRVRREPDTNTDIGIDPEPEQLWYESCVWVESTTRYLRHAEEKGFADAGIAPIPTGESAAAR